ncbi:MAG: alpha/beta hydrolase, partial [Bacteroidota bacterium]
KAGMQELQLDVYAPAAAGKPCPVIILFHGGSWVSGDKAQLQNQCRYFVQQGLVAVTANYRLLGQDTGPKDLCIMDARSAIRWVKSHAMQLHLDTANIILGGASAGGHLATMALLNQSINDEADDRAVSISARALVLFNPAYSVTEDPAVEPFHFVNAGVPPVIMFFGSRDKWKPAADSVRTLLIQAGVRCETWTANGETHGFFNKNPWMLTTCIKAHEFLSSLGLMLTTPASAPAILTADLSGVR